MFDNDVWQIIKSYLLDENDINYRIHIRQLNEERQRQECERRQIILLLECIYKSMSSDDEPEF